MNREWDKQMAYGTEARAGVSGPRDQPTWPPTQAEYGALISRITALTEENEQLKLECDTHRFDRRREQAESRLLLMEEALRAVLPRLAHEAQCGIVRPADEWLKYGSMNFENCCCEIKQVKAALAQPADAKPEQSSCAVVFGPEQQDYPGGPIYRVGTSTGVTLPTQPAAPQEKPEQADETAWLIERPEGRWGTGFYWCGLDGYAHSSGEWGVIEKAVRFSRKADAEKIIAGINVRQRRRRKDSLKMEACEHQWLATHPTPASGGQRDNDWILAIGHALGLDSGFDIPIVPEVEPFRKLFAAIRKQHVNDSGAKADTTARED